MKSSNEIDRKFKNGVDNFELTPKSNSWDQVAEKIDQNNNHYFWIASAAAVSLLCIFTFILFKQCLNHQPNQYWRLKKYLIQNCPRLSLS